MANGVVMERHEGTPQGGPLSPLAGQRAPRRSGQGAGATRATPSCATPTTATCTCGRRRAGERVMAVARRLYAKLRLRINEAKSAVAPAWRATVPGLRLLGGPGRNDQAPGGARRPSDDEGAGARDDAPQRRTEPGAGRRRSCASYLTGWKAYFRLAETPAGLRATSTSGSATDCARSSSSSGSGAGRSTASCALAGASRDRAARVAAQLPRWWRNSAHGACNIALPNRFFDELGVPRLAA